MRNTKMTLATLILSMSVAIAATAAESTLDYQILSTSRTSTMEKELNQKGASGYRFLKVTNGPNVFGGKELIVVTVRDLSSTAQQTRKYKVLSAGRNSTLQKKMQDAAKDGYEYLDQTTLPNIFGGTDVVVILERKEPKE
jgi:hypothetical protein